jgi:hypothetical protein
VNRKRWSGVGDKFPNLLGFSSVSATNSMSTVRIVPDFSGLQAAKGQQAFA